MFGPLLALTLAACSMSSGRHADHAARALPAPPEARTVEVTDTFHGVEVRDPYRWLEDADAPEVQAFVEAQNAYASEVLAGYPVRDVLKAELAEILGAERTTHRSVRFGGDRIFAMRRQPPKRQRFLVELEALSIDAPSRVLVDPEAVDPEGLTTIDWYVPSPDGTKVAVSMSRAGTESGDLHVFDVATGERLEDPLPRVNGGTAGGSLAWDADGTGFFYTRYPREGERPPEDLAFHVQLWHHALGDDPADDRYEIGEDFPRIAEIDVELHEGTGRLLVTVQDGDGGEFSHFLRSPDGRFSQLSTFGDGTVMMTFSEDGTAILAVSTAGAPTGRIVRFGIDEPGRVRAGIVADAEVLVESSDSETIVTSFWSPPSIVEIDGRIVYEVQLGGPSALRTVGGSEAPAPFEVGAISSMVRTPDDQLLYAASSFVDDRSWFAFDPAGGGNERLALDEPSPIELDGVEVVRELATSADGTKVPLNILLPPGVARDGSAPCVVTGYGGYGVSLTPYRRRDAVPLLRRGVIVVVANLRGGGEFGETWHEQGALTNKQNVFDDFAAVLDHLVQRDYTRPERTAIMGGSNGGLLVGALLTQHPDKVAAVMGAVGIYDMIRVELSPNGAFNVTEFGTVEDEAQFEALYGYSPYHHVEDGTDYPAVLLTTGANDPRVDPMQSRKMAARLQAAQGGGEPVLLQTDAAAGHGRGTPLDARIASKTDQLGFLLHHIGAPITPRR